MNHRRASAALLRSGRTASAQECEFELKESASSHRGPDFVRVTADPGSSWSPRRPDCCAIDRKSLPRPTRQYHRRAAGEFSIPIATLAQVFGGQNIPDANSPCSVLRQVACTTTWHGKFCLAQLLLRETVRRILPNHVERIFVRNCENRGSETGTEILLQRADFSFFMLNRRDAGSVQSVVFRHTELGPFCSRSSL